MPQAGHAPRARRRVWDRRGDKDRAAACTVSSLAGRTRCGDHDSTGAGPRTTSGVTGPTANALLPCAIDAAAGRKAGERAIEPAAVARRRFWQAAFQHILAVEMRALAIGRGAGMDDDRLVGGKHAMQVRHRRIEREEIVELERRRLALERQRIVAAQRDPVRIADRRHGGQPIERAAQHDGQKTRIAAFGERELRQIGPGEQRAGSQQQFAPRGCVEAMVISARIPAPSPEAPRPGRGFRRARWCRGFRPKRADRARCREARGSALLAASRPANPVGDIEPARHAVDPGRFGVGIAVRRRRPPQRFAERRLRAQHAADRE